MVKKFFLFLLIVFFVFVNACVETQSSVSNSVEKITCADGSVVNSIEDCVPKPVSCDDKCDGTTRLFNGKVVDGKCVYEEKVNALECGFVPGVTDPCESVSCENKCNGTTWLANGSCVDGECEYETSLEDSVKCKYDFNVFVQDCYYLGNPDNEFAIFFTIRNLSDVETNRRESVWLKEPSGKVYSYHYINGKYGKGRVLFDKITWNSTLINWRLLPHKGNLWTINNLEQGLKEENDKKIQLIYCPKESNPKKGDCDETNGLILYEGTTHDCLKKFHEEKYFPPSCKSDYCVKVGEFFEISVTNEGNNDFVSQDPTGFSPKAIWFIKKTNDTSNCQGQTGCYGKDIYKFKAKETGSYTIQIPKCKPWDCENTTKTEEFTIEIKEE